MDFQKRLIRRKGCEHFSQKVENKNFFQTVNSVSIFQEFYCKTSKILKVVGHVKTL